MLTRSRSLRFLRGNHKAREYEDDVLLPPKAPQTELDRYFTASPILRPERNLDAFDITQRPSTSDGVSDRSTKMFHLKSLNNSPSVHPHDRRIESPLRTSNMSPSVLYSAEVTTGSGVIGIALGSPTTGSHWNPTPHSSTSKLDLSADDNVSPPPPPPKTTQPWENSQQEPQKPKLSRWKSLFRKLPPPPPSPLAKPSFYSVVTTVTAAGHADSHHELVSQASFKREEEWARTVSPPFYKADIRESRRGTAEESSACSPRTRGRAVTAPSSAVPEVIISENTNDATSPPAGGLLDIAIPDIKMERYSVMFSSLLQPNASQSSSLLARRQGLTEKVKPLNELSIKVCNAVLYSSLFEIVLITHQEEHLPIDDKVRWPAANPTTATSSPRLSLFPSANSSRAPSPRIPTANRAEKKLQRSMTAPAKSPLRQTFSQPTMDANKKKEDTLTVKPKAAPSVKSPIHPPRIDSFEYQKDLAVKPLRIVKQEEPSPRTPVSVASKLTASAKPPQFPPRSDSVRQLQVTKMSALSSHPHSPLIEATSPLQRIQSLSSPTGSTHEARSKGSRSTGTRNAAKPAPKPEIGIARSVSLSRANSTRATAKTVTSTASVKSPPVAERLVDKRALMPTMVEVGNRQSHRVQLVDV